MKLELNVGLHLLTVLCLTLVREGGTLREGSERGGEDLRKVYKREGEYLREGSEREGETLREGSEREGETLRLVVDRFPREGSDWRASLILPEDFVVEALLFQGPGGLTAVYCRDGRSMEGSRGWNCSRRTPARVRITSEFTELFSVVVEDSGPYSWTVAVAEKAVTVRREARVVVRLQPRILRLSPVDLTIVEGDLVELLCEVDCGHVADSAALTLSNDKYHSKVTLKSFKQSPVSPEGRRVTRTLKSTLRLLEGDSFVECTSTNKFGDSEHKRVHFTVLAKRRFVAGTRLAVFCFTDFVSVREGTLKVVNKTCMVNRAPLRKQGGYSLTESDRFFLISVKSAQKEHAGDYECVLLLHSSKNARYDSLSTCQTRVEVFGPMVLKIFEHKVPLIAGRTMWVAATALPGEFWQRSYFKIYWHDLPETWRVEPPMEEITQKSEALLFVNISTTLPLDNVRHSLMKLCCDLINLHNIPTLIRKCLVRDIIFDLTGQLRTIPHIGTDQRIPLNTKVFCTGVSSSPPPRYTWTRLSPNKIEYNHPTIPDLRSEGAMLMIDDRVDIQSYTYQYRCTVSSKLSSLHLDVQFIVQLCDHEPTLELIIALNTQINTICAENNQQGREFVNVAYKPFLKRFLLALPITPLKTRVSLVPFLNYESRHNGTFVPLNNPDKVLKGLESYTSQYKAASSKPCDGMELSCTGQGLQSIHSFLSHQKRRPSSIVIIGRDVSACKNSDKDKEDMGTFSKYIKKDGTRIWLHYFKSDIHLLLEEERLIKPHKTFILVPGKSYNKIKAKTCCNIRKDKIKYSIDPRKFFRVICAEKSFARNPSTNITLEVYPSIIYYNLTIQIKCSGNPGYPGGKMLLCLVSDPNMRCITFIKSQTNMVNNNTHTTLFDLTLSSKQNLQWLKCMATNDLQVYGYDPEIYSAILLRYTEHPMVFINTYVSPSFINEGDDIIITCSFNLPIPPPLLLISLQKVGMLTQTLLTERISPDQLNLTNYKEQLLTTNVSVTLINISNMWDEGVVSCDIENSESKLMGLETILIQHTKVRRPSLDFEYSRSYDDQRNKLNITTSLREGYFISVNCSGKVGNLDNTIKLIINHSWHGVGIINDRDECYSIGHVDPHNYGCLEVRKITRNEDHRSIKVVIPRISSKGDWINFSCVANNSLNTLSSVANFYVYLEVKINYFVLQNRRAIVCNGSGHPKIEINVAPISSIPSDIMDIVEDITPTITHFSSSTEMKIIIPLEVKGIIIFRCFCSNVLEKKKHSLFYERSFLFLDKKETHVQLIISPAVVTVMTEVTFFCQSEVYLADLVQYAILYQNILTTSGKILNFPLIIRSLQSDSSQTFGVWKDIVVLKDTIQYSDKFLEWKMSIKPSSRWISGYYQCVIHYDGNAREKSRPPSNLLVIDRPSIPLVFLTNKNISLTILEEGKPFIVVCKVNVGLPSEQGAVTMFRNETQLRTNKYIVNVIDDGTQEVLITKNEVASKVQHKDVSYSCKASNILGEAYFSTGIITLYYGPYGISFIPFNRHVFLNGEVIECQAHANPHAEISWRIVLGPAGDKSKYLGSSLSFIKDRYLRLLNLSSGLYDFECHAKNYLNKTWRSLMFFVTKSKEVREDMRYEPKVPLVGGHLSLYCLYFVDLDKDIIVTTLITHVLWFKTVFDTQQRLPLLSYNFSTGQWRYYSQRKDFFMRGLPQLRLDIININEADFGQYGCTLRMGKTTSITMTTASEVCILDPPKSTKIIKHQLNNCTLNKTPLKLSCSADSGRLICGSIIHRNLLLKIRFKFSPRGRPTYEEVFILQRDNHSSNTKVYMMETYVMKSVTIDFHRSSVFCMMEGNISLPQSILAWKDLWLDSSGNSSRSSLLFSESIELCVLFSPQSIYLDPPSSNIQPGSSIYCSSWANPSPFVQWTVAYNWFTKNGLDKASLNIPKGLSAGRYSVQCTASNTINFINHSISELIKLTISQSAEVQWIRLLLMLLGVIILLILLCLLSFILIRCLIINRGICCCLPYSRGSDNESDMDDTDISVASEDHFPVITEEEIIEMINFNMIYGETMDYANCIEPPDVKQGPWHEYPAWKISKSRNILSEEI